MAYDRHHYRDPAVARSYEAERFGSPSGRRKHRHHVRRLLSALRRITAVGTILDIPCGTGRFHAALRAAGYRVIGADISLEMLARAPRPAPLLCTDLERAGLRNGAADLVLNLRHLAYVESSGRAAMLREMGRLARRHVVVEYSPCGFTWKARLRRRPGAFSREGIAREFAEAGLRLRAVHPLSLLFSEKCLAVGEVPAPPLRP